MMIQRTLKLNGMKNCGHREQPETGNLSWKVWSWFFRAVGSTVDTMETDDVEMWNWAHDYKTEHFFDLVLFVSWMVAAKLMIC